MLESPSNETPIVPARLQDEAGPNQEDPANLIADLHGLIDSVKLGDDPGALCTQLEEFMNGFNKLESFRDTDLIGPVAEHLVVSAFDFSQTHCLPLLTYIVDHPVAAEFLVSTGILVSLIQDGYWSVRCVRTRGLILGLVGRLLGEGDAALPYFAQIGLIELLCRQYEETRELPWRNLDREVLLRELMRAAEAFARFPNHLSPDHCTLLVALADDVLARHASYSDIISALTILRFFIECPDISLDFLERSPVLGLLTGFFEDTSRVHWPAWMSFMEACVRRPELNGFIDSIDMVGFAGNMLPHLESDAEFKAFAVLLSSFLSVNPGSIEPLIHGAFFDAFLSAIARADFGTKQEFTGLLLTVLSLVDAAELYALMSDSLVCFFFDFLQSADSQMRLLSLHALLAVSQRGVEFGGSAHPFVLGLIDFLDNSPDDLADVIRALTGLD
jgi:hypothetical protein